MGSCNSVLKAMATWEKNTIKSTGWKVEITWTCQPKRRQLKKNPFVESNHIYSYRTPMRLAMGKWFLYWSVNLRWVQKQEDNWKAESRMSWEIIGSPCCEGAILRIQNAQIRMIANYMRLEVQLDFFLPNFVAWVWRRRRKRLEMVVLKIVDSLVLVYLILYNLFFDMNFARIFIFRNVLPKSTDDFQFI